MKKHLSTFVIVLIVGAVFLSLSNRRVFDWWNGGAAEEPFNQLAAGILHGHIYLDRDVPQDIQKLWDPYDPQINNGHLLTDEGSFWDLSLCHNHFYVYYGPAPAFLFFVPYHLITQSWASQRVVAVLLFTLGFLFCALLLRDIRDHHFKLTKDFTLNLMTLVVGLGSCMPLAISSAGMYEVATGSAWAFLMGSFYFTYLALRTDEDSPLVAAGLCFMISVLSRLEFIVAFPILLLPWWVYRHPSFFLHLLWAGFAIVLTGAYNDARFGNIFETGRSYLLSTGHNNCGLALSNIPKNIAIYWIEGMRFSRRLANLHEN